MREFVKWLAVSVVCTLGATLARRLIRRAYKKTVDSYSVAPKPGRHD